MGNSDGQGRIKYISRLIEIVAALVTLIGAAVTIVVWVMGHLVLGMAFLVATILLILATRRKLAGLLRYRRDLHSDYLHPRARLALVNSIYSWRVQQGFDVAITRIGARLPIELNPRPDLVQAEFKTDTTPSSEAVSVKEAFDRAQGRLLIVGEPGSGKTTLALELLKSLLYCARVDTTSSIPEMFSLATWPKYHKPLEEWLKDELSERGFGPSWIDRRMIAPILDGFDELRSDVRVACLSAINDFRSRNEGVPIVVTSRLTEYEAVPRMSRLMFGGAYIVRPLSDEEVTDYVASRAKSDPQWAEVAHTIAQQDYSDLRRRLRNPLILNMVAIASANDAPEAVLESFRHASFGHFWSYFVETMRRQTLDPRHREPDNPDATPVRDRAPAYRASEVRRWLGWLASEETSSSEFRLTRLALPPSRFGPTSTVQRLCIDALAGILAGSIALAFGYVTGRSSQPFGVAVYLAAGLCAGLLFGTIRQYFSALLTELQAKGLWALRSACPLVAMPLAAFTSGTAYIEIAGHIGGILGFILGLAVGTLVGIGAFLLIVFAIDPTGPTPNFGSAWLYTFWVFPSLLLAVPAAIAVAHWSDELLANWFYGLCLLVTLFYGLILIMTHVLWYPVLRIRTWYQGLLPLRVNAFLKWATTHLYLQRAGEAFRWFHPSLATYLARTSGHVSISRFLLMEADPLLRHFDRSEISQRDVWPLIDDQYDFLLSIVPKYSDPEITHYAQNSYDSFLEAKQAVSNRDDFFSAKDKQLKALGTILTLLKDRRFRGAKPDDDSKKIFRFASWLVGLTPKHRR